MLKKGHIQVMKKFIHMILIVFVSSVVLFFLYQKYQSDLHYIKEQQRDLFTDRFNNAVTTYRLNALNSYKNIVMQEDVLEILRELPDANASKFDQFHDQLYKLLQSRYQNMANDLSIRQLHFHTKDGRSFLRMHRPQKYGDPLFDARYSVYLANTKNIAIEGFEEGRIFNGYRFVYPIFDHGAHLGSVEISISINAIINQLITTTNINSVYFMIKKSTVDAKVFGDEKGNYLPSRLSEEYFVDKESYTLFNPAFEPYLELLSHKMRLKKMVKEELDCVTSLSYKGKNVITVLKPIKNIKSQHVAYLINFLQSDQIESRYNEWFYQMLAIIFATLMLMTIIYTLEMKTAKIEADKNELNRLVDEKTAEIKRIKDAKIENYKNTILALVNLTEERDTYTAGHTRRVAQYALMIGRKMGLSEKELQNLEEAAILHDIGKIVTPDSVLLKPGGLNAREYDIIKGHVVVGEAILKDINFDPEIITTIKYHHERSDGSGYPHGMTDAQIPLLAKILAVADTFDAMTTNRIYKPRKDVAVALKELKALKGVHYNSEVVDVALKALEDVNVDQTTMQLPTNVIEEERLSHYFKDPLTGLYNLRYLHLVLKHGINEKHFTCANIISIRRFTQFNQKNGWEIGDRLLMDLAKILQNKFDASMVFRVYGDDFVLLSYEHLEMDIGEIQSAIRKVCSFNIELNCNHIDIHNQQERIELATNLEKLIG